jgi:hypothetical protein
MVPAGYSAEIRGRTAQMMLAFSETGASSTDRAAAKIFDRQLVVRSRQQALVSLNPPAPRPPPPAPAPPLSPAACVGSSSGMAPIDSVRGLWQWGRRFGGVLCFRTRTGRRARLRSDG